ncbi:MAG: MATE family efflux transporter, partial [Planctomycetota bacterium]
MKNHLLEKHFAGPGGINQMLAIALPMVISSACDTLMMFTDRLFLSRLGPENMSAAMGGGLTVFMMTTFFWGLTSYCTALVAQYLGAGRKEHCAVAITQGFIIIIAAFPVILFCRPLGPLLFKWMHIPPEQMIPQAVYYNILIYGTVISLARNCLSCFFSGIGHTRVVMVSAIISMVVNITLNYILIFGKLGVPAMGIRGAAYGTITGSLCGLLVLTIAYLQRTNRTEYGIASSFHFDKAAMGKLLRFGYPAGTELFLNLVAFNLLILMLHGQGLKTAAAVTVVFNWDMVSFVPLIGVNIGVTSLVGRFMGAGDPDTANRATFSGVKVALLYSFCTLIAFAFFPKPLVWLFRPSGEDAIFSEAFPLAVFMLRIASVYVISDAMMLVFSGALRGAGDTFWAMCISVVMHWVMVSVLAVMLYGLHWSAGGSWVVLCVVFMMLSGAFYLRYHIGKWRSIHVIEQRPEMVPLMTDGFH